MPHLDSKGPEGKGSGTGRGLGNCKKSTSDNHKLGEGMGKRRKAGDTCAGKGKRLKSGKQFDK